MTPNTIKPSGQPVKVAFDPLVSPNCPKPFGYVLKSVTPNTRFPWLRVRVADNRTAMSGFTACIGDARVFKRLKTAQQWPHLEIVPVYSDPRRTGERALIKPLTRADITNLAMVGRNERKFDKIIHENAIKQWVGIGWVTERVAEPTDYYKFPNVQD